jgi:hypothetical protein
MCRGTAHGARQTVLELFRERHGLVRRPRLRGGVIRSLHTEIVCHGVVACRARLVEQLIRFAQFTAYLFEVNACFAQLQQGHVALSSRFELGRDEKRVFGRAPCHGGGALGCRGGFLSALMSLSRLCARRSQRLESRARLFETSVSQEFTFERTDGVGCARSVVNDLQQARGHMRECSKSRIRRDALLFPAHAFLLRACPRVVIVLRAPKHIFDGARARVRVERRAREFDCALFLPKSLAQSGEAPLLFHACAFALCVLRVFSHHIERALEFGDSGIVCVE